MRAARLRSGAAHAREGRVLRDMPTMWKAWILSLRRHAVCHCSRVVESQVVVVANKNLSFTHRMELIGNPSRCYASYLIAAGAKVPRYGDCLT